MSDQPKKKVNTKDEIIKLLKNYNFNDKSRRYFDPYKAVTNDIIALFGMGGEAKVEYFLEFKDFVGWHNYWVGYDLLNLETAQIWLKRLREKHPVNEWHIIERTTVITDETIK